MSYSHLGALGRFRKKSRKRIRLLEEALERVGISTEEGEEGPELPPGELPPGEPPLSPGGGMSTGWILPTAGGVAAVGLIAFFLLRRKKRATMAANRRRRRR